MIIIKKSNKGDTRTCDVTKVSEEEFRNDINSHIQDVYKAMNFFSEKIKDAGHNHDYTKITDFGDFFRDFKSNFENQTWWIKHQELERHHLTNPKYVQNDVNLIDILEMISDGVMAGMARSGKYRHEEISDELLRKAFNNTIKLLLEEVVLEREGE